MNVTINSWDAKAKWGIVFESSSISALMTPAPMKDYIENSSRLEHGKRVLTNNAKVDSRSISLTFSLYASNEDLFYERYDSFCAELEKGKINISLSNRPEIVYKLVYKSCKQFTQYNNKLAKYVLIVEEPNPKDRSL